MKRGSAMIYAIWTIAVLSILVLSFAYEAHQQAGVNVYVRERNRVNRLTEAAQALAEVVLVGYPDVSDWTEDQDNEELLEKDRWYLEKQELKMDGKCTIGPILLDDTRDRETDELINSSTITIEISTVNSGEKGIININQLYKGAGDDRYTERWWMIFQSHGIPEELKTEKDGTINLWNILIASWDDWRDEDDLVTQIDGEDCGAESKWYEDYEDENRIDDEDKRRPRNGPIPDIRELAYLRGWREYPQVLTGGVLNPWAHKDDQVTVRGLESLFCTEGSSKINVNTCSSVDALVTIPGIYQDPDDEEEAVAEAQGVANMIIDGLKIMPTEYSVDETRTWWPYKDWNDLTERVDDDIGNDASQYLVFTADDSSIFKIRMIGQSGMMKHEVTAECYVKDKKVRYISWRED